MSQFYALFRLTLIPAILLIFNPLASIVNAQEPPQASFTFTWPGLSVQFTDTSTDPDGNIVA